MTIKEAKQLAKLAGVAAPRNGDHLIEILEAAGYQIGLDHADAAWVVVNASGDVIARLI